MIRGEENTTVRLKIQPADDPTTFRELKIVRAKVEIKDTLAKAELIELNKPGAAPLRIGWIELESFYADMENMNAREPSAPPPTSSPSCPVCRKRRSTDWCSICAAMAAAPSRKPSV